MPTSRRWLANIVKRMNWNKKKWWRIFNVNSTETWPLFTVINLWMAVSFIPSSGHWFFEGYIHSPFESRALHWVSVSKPDPQVSGQHRLASLAQLAQYFFAYAQSFVGPQFGVFARHSSSSLGTHSMRRKIICHKCMFNIIYHYFFP